MKTRYPSRVAFAVTAALAAGSPVGMALAQSAQQAGGEPALPGNETLDEVTVVGSRLSANVEAALPVTTYGVEELEALGAVTGDDLIRSLPGFGDVNWHPLSQASGSNQNAPRGDTGSINLKNLGTSNTLLLINGRRSVLHSTTQGSEFGYNSNAIPTYGLQRLEVLRDGAAALYGSDAVAGVVNIVTPRNLQGGSVQLQYGSAQGTNKTDLEVTGSFGHDFNGGRGHFGVSFASNKRTSIRAADNWYTAVSDRREFFPNTPLYGANSLDTRGTSTPWATLRSVSGRVFQGGTPITNADGVFHIQPLTNAGSLIDLGNGIAIDDGAPAYSGADRNLRYEAAEPGVELTPSTERHSFFGTWRHDINTAVEAYGELGYYWADSTMYVPSGSVSGIQPVYIPASAYWNPFGAVTLPDGSPNPNRVPGLVGVPNEGVALEITNYRLADVGAGPVTVTNTQGRVLGGLRSTWRGFDWDSAVLYSWSRSPDRTYQRFDVNEFVEALSRSTPDAYNPFNGGSLDNPSVGDATPGGDPNAGEAGTAAARRRPRDRKRSSER